MFDILDVLAVREAVERQRPLRRRICRLLMQDYTRSEVAETLGLSRFALRRQVLAIRRSFCRMGFEEWLLPRRAAQRRARTQASRDGRPVAIVRPSWRRI